MLAAEKFYAIPKIVYCYNKENNKVHWTAQKVHGLLCGLIENLKISKEKHLSTLHRITVKHLNEDFRNIINIFATKDHPDLLELLCKAYNTISIELLFSDKHREISQLKQELDSRNREIYQLRHGSYIRRVARAVVPNRAKPCLKAILHRIPQGIKAPLKRLLHW